MMVYCYRSITLITPGARGHAEQLALSHVLVAMQSGIANLENNLVISYKFNVYLPDGQAVSLLEKQKHMFIQKLCT